MKNLIVPVVLLVSGLLCVPTCPVAAVVISLGDGSGNTTPPADDPGFRRLGTKAPCPPQCGLSYVYLGAHGGRHWVLTAHHVSAQDVEFEWEKKVYAMVPGSARRIGGPQSNVDLLLFELQGGPGFPLLKISKRSPAPGTEVVMIGRGQSRAAALSGTPPEGQQAAEPSVMRWGTNRVDSVSLHNGQHILSTRFDPPQAPGATRHEAQATLGDSGGGIFVEGKKGWELAGIMVRASAVHFGTGYTIAVDLSHYRDEVMGRVQPSK